MKILSWNCNGAFRKKIEIVKNLKVDIAIIQECEKSELWSDLRAHDWIWQGDRKSKGVGVFSFKPGLTLNPIEFSLEFNHWFIPLEFSNGLRLMAVWAMNHRGNEVVESIQPTFRTIEDNKELISTMDIIAGDFNNNVVWDSGPSRKFAKGSFRDILTTLKSLGFNSLYHHSTSEGFGEETTASLFLQRNLEKPYHVDYAFAAQPLLSNMRFEILKDPIYLQHSDHRPLLMNINA